MNSTVDFSEIQNFTKSSAHWWDAEGPHAPLHKLNPTRIAYIRDQIATHYGRDPFSHAPLDHLSILDVGCGGGLLCEPLSRLGADVTGLDADSQAIEVARSHAQKMHLDITYINDAVENLGAKKYDAILIVEIVEHVADLPAFLLACTKVLKKGGILVFSTLNRTTLSYALGIVMAEKILRWVPDGTHDWDKFVTPSEMSSYLKECDLTIRNLQGISYVMTKDQWTLSQDLSVNYIGVATQNL